MARPTKRSLAAKKRWAKRKAVAKATPDNTNVIPFTTVTDKFIAGLEADFQAKLAMIRQIMKGD